MIVNYYKNVNYQKPRTLKKFTKGSWICVSNPDQEELELLRNDYMLDVSLLHDALDPYEVPRIEVEDGVVYFFTRYVTNKKKGKLETLPFVIAIGENYLATISSEELPFVSEVCEKKDFYTTQKTKALLQILMRVLSDFRHHTHQISKELQNQGSRIENISNKEISNFVDYERTLNEFLSTLIPTNMILKNLLKGKILKLYDEDTDLVEDLSLGIEQLMEISKSNIRNIINIREAYSTIVSNNLNKSMKLLTALTAILTIPTIISSFFGMNVPLPLQDFTHAFVLILSITVLLVIVIISIFAKNRLL